MLIFFPWSTNNLFGLRLDSFIILIKQLRILLAFSSFESLTQAYLVKTSIALNKYLTPQFLEDNDLISSKPPTQIFPFRSCIQFYFF